MPGHAHTAKLGFSALCAAVAALAGCGSREPTPRTPAPPRAPPASPLPSDAGTDARSDAAPSGSEDAGPSVELRMQPVEPAAPPSVLPQVEILFPFAEQRVLIPKARGYVVRVRIDAWPLGREGKGVLIALDDARPHRVQPKTEIRLGDLGAEGHELAPGAHWLTLAAVDETGAVVRGNGGSRAPFAKTHFWIGERDLAVRPEPHVTLISPAGTYNGDAAARVLVDFVAGPERLGAAGGRARARLTGAGVERETELSSWRPIALEGLANGDFTLEVVLEDEHGKALAAPGARATRIITLNREARAPR